MLRYSGMLSRGLIKRGHHVTIWTPQPRCSRFSGKTWISKWLGYIDQYILFPAEVNSSLKKCSPDTLFVFTDHALGPWIPLVANRPHIIHCHDFLAQFSALGRVPECQTGWPGKKYQEYIRKGFQQGKNFISVSHKTRQDLREFLKLPPACSEVVYNGFNQPFTPLNIDDARDQLGKQIKIDLTQGYVLHVGGNHWYKNRTGVIEIYDAWRLSFRNRIPLLMIGQSPATALKERHEQSLFKKDIYMLSNLEDESVRMAYAGAIVFLFPSLAEGFGWPIAEAMASGTPVITTNEPPMTEVSGNAGYKIPKRPCDVRLAEAWAIESAGVLNKVITLTDCERKKAIEAGRDNARRFDPDCALDAIETIYKHVLTNNQV